MRVLKIYTDSSCRREDKRTSLAYIVVEGEKIICENVRVIDEYVISNYSELMAVLNALNWLRSNKLNKTRIYIYTDSQYVQLGFTKRQENKWLNEEENTTWKKIRDIISEFKSVYVQWIPSHAENLYNNRADELCTISLINFNKTDDVFKKISK